MATLKKAITITIANFKGGVGKTTTLLNLAHEFVLRGFKVLIIDHDPQGNATSGLGVTVSPTLRTLSEALKDMKGLPCYVIEEKLHLVPTDERLTNIDNDLKDIKGRFGRLCQLIDAVRNQYDLIFIDCPPAHGMGTNGPLIAADKVLIPIETAMFSIRGLQEMYSTIEEAKSRNPSLSVLGILPTRHKMSSKDHRFVLAEVRQMFPNDILSTCIRDSTSISAAQLARTNIFEFLPKSNGAIDYRRLADEIARKLNINSKENGE